MKKEQRAIKIPKKRRPRRRNARQWADLRMCRRYSAIEEGNARAFPLDHIEAAELLGIEPDVVERLVEGGMIDAEAVDAISWDAMHRYALEWTPDEKRVEAFERQILWLLRDCENYPRSFRDIARSASEEIARRWAAEARRESPDFAAKLDALAVELAEPN